MTRVIRNGGAPAPRGVDFTPSARRIDAARFLARIEAEKAIAAAREEADVIRARARDEGLQRGRAEGLAQLTELQRRIADVGERSVDLVVTATRAVAERAIGAALTTDDQTLTAWARQALATFGGARKVELAANDATLRRLAGIGGIDLVADNDLPDFVLVARTELGDARIELGTQVEAFVDSIREVLSLEVSKK